jgi:hypothetical protein
MEGLAVQSPKREDQTDRSDRWRDLVLLALLLMAAVGMRAWLLCHTEVAARDSIGFIRYALTLEKKGWEYALQHNHQHPGYPLSLLAVSWPVRAFVTGTEADVMQLCAQLATALAGVLLVIPMYYIGKHFFHRAAGFWAALVFQCLPVSGHILSDGLSEGLFLLLTAVALLYACRAVEGSSLRPFAWCGVFCGLAYVTRPEGAMLLVATLVVLALMQFIPAWRRSWRQFASCGAALVLPALVVGSPYFLTIGSFTTKPSVRQVIGTEVATRAEESISGAHEPPALRPAAVVPAVSLNLEGSQVRRLALGLWGLGTEVTNAFHYVAWIPAVLGIWYVRRRVWHRSGTCVVVVFCGLHALVLWRLAVIVGYLSDRHVLVLVLCGIYPAVVFVWELPSWLLSWLRRDGTATTVPRTAGVALTSVALLVVLTGVGLPKTLQTLHAQRAGYHAAGLWLAKHAKDCDVIMDRHLWAHYYSGRVFLEEKIIPIPAGHRPVCYHVVGKGKEREQDPTLPQAFLSEEQVRARGGKSVYHWPPNRECERAAVVVYVMPEGFRNP